MQAVSSSIWAYIQNLKVVRYFRKMRAEKEPIGLIYPVDYAGELRTPFQYIDPSLVSGVLKGVVANDLDKVKQLVEAGKSVNINDNNGNTPLHVAVIKNSCDIVNYLLTRDELVINSRNFWDETPLLLAARRGNYEICQALIEKGAEVNKGPHYPLHVAVSFPNVLHLLIQNGADVDVQDINNETALHEAILIENLESICMLLYYGADANILGDYDMTPFAKTLLVENREIQTTLIDYVTDFNARKSDGDSILLSALRSQSSILEDIVARGAKFHDLEYLDCYSLNNIETFSLLWNTIDKVQPEYIDSVIPFLNGLSKLGVEQFATVMMSNEYMMQMFSMHVKLHRFLKVFGKFELLDLTTKFTYIYLMYGYQLCFQDIKQIFKSFGTCELLLQLRYFDLMDRPSFTDSSGWLVWVLFSLESNLDSVSIVLEPDISMDELLKDIRFLFQYIVCGHIADKFQTDVEKKKMPSLLELARNKSKEHLVQKYKLQKHLQYYNLIDKLKIPDDYKNILKYERKLYSIDK